MGTARIYKKGQITIPEAVREAAGFDIGDSVIVEARDQEIVVRRPHGVLEFEPPSSRRASDPTWRQARQVAREDRITDRT